MNERYFRVLIALCLVAVSTGFSGRPRSHERWAIKTTYDEAPGHAHTIELAALMKLPSPRNVTVTRYNRRLIGGSFGGFREGEFVGTTGWLHLAAFSSDDSDYHLQVTSTKQSGNNCVIVEIPDPRNAASPAIRAQWSAERKSIDYLCGGKRPPEAGKILSPPVQVRITGQLFYDISHKNPKSRGKRMMKAATSWEIHPVWTISRINQ
jgi:hypothetical protein